MQKFKKIDIKRTISILKNNDLLDNNWISISIKEKSIPPLFLFKNRNLAINELDTLCEQDSKKFKTKIYK